MISPVGQHPMKANFILDGEKLSGVMRGEAGELPFEGTLADKKIRIGFKVPYQGTDLHSQAPVAGRVCHRFRIAALSRTGKGCTFRVNVPGPGRG